MVSEGGEGENVRNRGTDLLPRWAITSTAGIGALDSEKPTPGSTAGVVGLGIRITGDGKRDSRQSVVWRLFPPK